MELYEGSGGLDGTTLRETGLSVIIVTNHGNRTGAIRTTPLMRVKDGNSCVLVGPRGARAENPEWAHNFRSDGNVQLRQEAEVYTMRVREVDNADRADGVVGPGNGSVSTLRRVS